ncbi:GspE/PulE family protein [Photobacterium kishitanii]|uniref:Bacterial type II secretion system protein E domain-containing protein n=1 Tax=Photobacterium kishitanii TaxID=318456 RepID=A0A2T3KN15_9GAMM|nr:ATPase, T2SS/T4P/T4SS family [Photobacterium kishitanii]PSV01168.1 hypothetical protein C9J27_03855 [Photobacterium kishitanii]
MIDKIQYINDLNNDWILIGVENGENQKVKVNRLDRGLVAVVKVKANGSLAHNHIYILGQKKFLASEDGWKIINSVREKYEDESKMVVSAQPVNDQKLIQSIYEEWNEMVKSNSTKMDDGKADVVSSLKNVKEAEELISKCLAEGVSDLHLEARENNARIRKRLNGEIVPERQLSSHEGLLWGNTLYNVLVKIGSSTFNKNKPQDGLIQKELDGVNLRGRVATSPVAPNGFDIVIRLLKIQNASTPKSLDELGYAKRECRRIEIATSKPSGIILVTGTTGSGKSTTLQNLLMTRILEAKNRIKVITVEDPVEYYIMGATQISVVRDKDGDASVSFNGAIRTALRQDPDILMVGEIRDLQSASLVQAAAQSGHPVYSTLHASSCISAIARLEALGISRDILSSQNFLAGIVYQKLLGKICPKCALKISEGMTPIQHSERDLLSSLEILPTSKVDFWSDRYSKTSDRHKVSFVRYLQDQGELTGMNADIIADAYARYNNIEKRQALYERIAAVSDIKNDNIIFKGHGCENCRGTGVIGRVPVSEGITFNSEMLDIISRNQELELITYWQKNMGGRSALEDAVDKMRIGLLDANDIEGHLDKIGTPVI